MTSQELRTDPPSVDLPDGVLSAVVAPAEPDSGWRLTVVIARGPDEPRLDARDVDAELEDAAGCRLPLIERDRGLLVDAGGSLGTSANAVFRFGVGSAPPAALRVTFRGRSADFRLRPA